MKILKSIFVLVLFSNFIVSCTSDDIVQEQETKATENVQIQTIPLENTQATGENKEEVDQTEKG